MGQPSCAVRTTSAPAAGLLVWLAMAAGSATAAAGPWRVTVQGRGGDLGETPVVVEISAAVPQGAYRLVPEAGSPGTAAHVFHDAGKTYLGTVLDRVPGKTVRTYILEPDPTTGPGGRVAIRKQGETLEVSLGPSPFFVYRPDDAPKPYYFPVFGPNGRPITRAYPMKDVPGEARDHPHQRSVWFTHGKVNGVDFWSEMKGHGSIKETARPTVSAGVAVALIRTKDDWLGPDGKTVCEDERVVRVYQTTKARVFDFDIVIKASAGPVTFGDTKEGMFGVRVASSMDVKAKQGGRITNAEGLIDGAAWGKASPWVDYTGPVAGQTVGVAILNHPESFRFPTTWHVRDYGLFAANPFGWHDFGRKESGDYTLPEGGSIRFRYRVILHDGDTASARLAEAFRAYAEPPSVEVKSD